MACRANATSKSFLLYSSRRRNFFQKRIQQPTRTIHEKHILIYRPALSGIIRWVFHVTLTMINTKSIAKIRFAHFKSAPDKQLNKSFLTKLPLLPPHSPDTVIRTDDFLYSMIKMLAMRLQQNRFSRRSLPKTVSGIQVKKTVITKLESCTRSHNTMLSSVLFFKFLD